MARIEQVAMYGCAQAVVMIKWDDDWEEFVCELYLREGETLIHQQRANYHTDDEDDARQSARQMLIPYKDDDDE